MVIGKVVVCPICEKRIYLRIQDGGYLEQYPIRVYCANCRTLIKGTYFMRNNQGDNGLEIYNAKVEECEVDAVNYKILNADYIMNISGELPCRKIRKFDGNMIIDSPFIEWANKIDMQKRIDELKSFNWNMKRWTKWRSIAFQLLEDGELNHIPIAIRNKMGEYPYLCDNVLKTLHCLQEIAHEETKILFHEQTQDEIIKELLFVLSKINEEQLHEFVSQIGGIKKIIMYYRKAIGVFNAFMNIYPYVLPAETYMQYRKGIEADIGIATCSLSDIKIFYQDSYESLLELMFIPVCIDNILNRGDYKHFNKSYEYLFRKKRYHDLENDYFRYMALDNGAKSDNHIVLEEVHKIINISANRTLRNGIGHNSVQYDGLTQEILVYDIKNPNEIRLKTQVIDIAIECIGLAKSSIIMAELLLFILRKECQRENIKTIMHPKFYKDAERNSKYPCGSNKKYKKCCRTEISVVLR